MQEPISGQAGSTPAGAYESRASASPPHEKILPPHADALRSEAEAYGLSVQQRARRWIESNPTLALLSGFAVGVFVGAWVRG